MNLGGTLKVSRSNDARGVQAKGWGFLDNRDQEHLGADAETPSCFPPEVQMGPPFLGRHLSALRETGIIPKKTSPASSRRAAFYKHPIGTGPFQWDSRP